MFCKKSALSSEEKSPYEIFTEKQIKEAFEVFDEDRRGKAKLKHLGTILRAMGRVPTQQAIEDLIEKVHDPEYPGYFTITKLIPPLAEILMNDEGKSSTRENLIQAFKVLDASRNNYVEKDCLENAFLEHGDSFPPEDVAKFREYITDEFSSKVNYKEYVSQLTAPQFFDIAESRRKIREKLVDNRYRMC